jgi:hypothetical protein
MLTLARAPSLHDENRNGTNGSVHHPAREQQRDSGRLRPPGDAKRIELRTADLRKAESVLSAGSGPDKDIIDVERFGDRLDLLVHDPDKAQKWVSEKLKSAGLYRKHNSEIQYGIGRRWNSCRRPAD